MKIRNDMTKARHGKQQVCGAIMILALLGAQGCSTATAAGCGVGVLAGMALAGVAAASAPKNSSVDGGAVVLGGGIFGVASGCSAAAVAAAVASPKKHTDPTWTPAPEESEGDPQSAEAPPAKPPRSTPYK